MFLISDTYLGARQGTKKSIFKNSSGFFLLLLFLSLKEAAWFYIRNFLVGVLGEGRGMPLPAMNRTRKAVKGNNSTLSSHTHTHTVNLQAIEL